MCIYRFMDVCMLLCLFIMTKTGILYMGMLYTLINSRGIDEQSTEAASSSGSSQGTVVHVLQGRCTSVIS